MKKHFKIILVILLLSCIVICDVKPVRAQGLINAWDTYYNWLVELNYRKTQKTNLRLKEQYNKVRNVLDLAVKFFTGSDPTVDILGSHNGGGHSRTGAENIISAPVSDPQPIYNNTTKKIYNPVTNNYETIEYYLDDSSEEYVYSFETTNNFITYEYNYTYYDIVVSPKESPTDGKFFKVYYQLPDGRSSYNLTPDDINGVIFNYDVLNYERTVTDRNVLGIWHLDGDYLNSVDNSNYFWSYNNNFIDGRFGGCLYRDGSYSYVAHSSSVHHFNNDIRLYVENFPITVNDWTLEFWVYCPDPSTTLWQNSSGQYCRSVPNSFIFDSVPCWLPVAIQSDGKYFVNGKFINATPFWQTSESFNNTGRLDKFLTVSEFGRSFTIYFAFSGYGNQSVENNVTYMNYDMATFGIDEVKLTNGLLYDSSGYVPRTEPFDLTYAYTVPSLNQNFNSIAIQSPVNVNNTQIGGVRSPNPLLGDVFISLYDGRATSVSQFYNGQWNTVNGAVYLNGKWFDLLQYDFNTLMLSPDTEANNGATYIINNYFGNDSFVDISGDDITFTIDTTDAKPDDVIKILKWIPLLFGAVGTILGALCPFLPAWLTGLIAMCLGCILTLILFVFIRRK